jgi:hypothetical protein
LEQSVPGDLRWRSTKRSGTSGVTSPTPIWKIPLKTTGKFQKRSEIADLDCGDTLAMLDGVCGTQVVAAATIVPCS